MEFVMAVVAVISLAATFFSLGYMIGVNQSNKQK